MMSNSNDDFSLWRSIIQDIKKLDNKKKIPAPINPLPQITPQPLDYSSKLKASSLSQNLADLQVNNTSGIDKSSLKKIQRGEYQIDAVLDLHGMTQEQAYLNFSRLVAESYNQHKRLLLIIVGKGKKSGNNQGLLRNLLPAWANYPTLRPMILSIKTASGQHGGEGAYYILLIIKKNKK